MKTRRRTSKGFTLIEAILSLVILVVLLTALGTAFHATLMSYSENEKIAITTQAARALLDRMMREIRTAAAVEANQWVITIVPPSDPTGLQLIRYEYDPSGKRLYYTRTVLGDSNTYAIFGQEVDLISFSVDKQTGLDWQGMPCTKSVRVKIGLRKGTRDFYVTAAAAPRRNQLY